MKILFLTATYEPSANGVAVCVKTTMEALVKKGHEVTVLAPETPGFKDNYPNILRYPSIPNPLNKDYPLPMLPLNSKVFSQLLNKDFDIVHVHHPFYIAWFAEKYANVGDVPFVFTYHTRYEDYADIYLKFLPKKFRAQIVKLGADAVCKKADLVIAPSRTIGNELHIKYPYTQINVMPTGVSFPSIENIKHNYLREKLKLPDDSIILVSLSRIAEEKNLTLLLESLLQLPANYHLVLAGSGPFENELKELANKLGINKKVTFLGRVERENVPNVLSSADMYLFPSVTETQGLSLLEAMYFGLPVVAVDSAVCREWVLDNLAVITGNTASSFVDGILAMNAKRNKKLQSEIKTWASSFTIEKTTEDLLINYEEAINRRKLTNKLAKTGWQSWSTDENSLLKFPTRNYPPTKDNYICKNISTNNKRRPITGWCSWYAFFDKISEDIILKQADFISKNHAKIPLEYIIVDDGWAIWGDWKNFDKNKFPKGAKYLTQEIDKKGLKTGIWLAPFLVEKNSDIFKSHKDWLVSKEGFLAEGFKVNPLIDRLWKYSRYILDIKKEPARQYLFDCLDELVEKNGFELLKLDFLYAPYFDPNLETREAGSLIHTFLKDVKSRYPEIHLNACGVPLACAAGVVDSVRIGPDTIAPPLDNTSIIGSYINSQKIKQAINTIEKRQWTSSLWICDPDVFVCRPSLKIKPKLIMELRNTVLRTKGNILLGDDLTALSKHELETYIYPFFS
ncbi:hypothetical protein A2415_02955 [candidate division WWE3 bacterium RIFOXYC1_FULL_39_7]|uniref:Glycosyltransferase subfamily 4-like N-terminal domain-containing protein n=2 Tax=Katanobacteria TaxID=422282 RepID=A0A1F4XA95_UNCKA|nr:MAG: hypothetical protein A2415_02955 [candidate division WWE3 bacterium RIFOXYC1_FULL_39_7]OGC77993.1 MAG: hypothetical protein A2619_02800 [candidate division WWE3 bacterium RIFOXYD1_FULL_39_9]